MILYGIIHVFIYINADLLPQHYRAADEVNERYT